MLEPLFSVLNKKRIVLASASPRRREIVRVLGLRCQIVASSFKENLDKSRFAQPVDYALATAIGKAQSVAKALREEPTPVDLVIGADTIVGEEVVKRGGSLLDVIGGLNFFCAFFSNICSTP